MLGTVTAEMGLNQSRHVRAAPVQQRLSQSTASFDFLRGNLEAELNTNLSLDCDRFIFSIGFAHLSSTTLLPYETRVHHGHLPEKTLIVFSNFIL